MQVSSYLIIPLIASRRENKLPCAVRGKKTRLEYTRRRRQVQLGNATMTLYGQYNTEHHASAQDYQGTNKQSHVIGEGQSDCS